MEGRPLRGGCGGHRSGGLGNGSRLCAGGKGCRQQRATQGTYMGDPSLRHESVISQDGSKGKVVILAVMRSAGEVVTGWCRQPVSLWCESGQVWRDGVHARRLQSSTLGSRAYLRQNRKTPSPSVPWGPGCPFEVGNARHPSLRSVSIVREGCSRRGTRW